MNWLQFYGLTPQLIPDITFVISQPLLVISINCRARHSFKEEKVNRKFYPFSDLVDIY